MEVEYSLFIEEFSLPRGHAPLPCLLDGGYKICYTVIPYIRRCSLSLLSHSVKVLNYVVLDVVEHGFGYFCCP